MHIGHASQDLFHVVLYLLYWDQLALLFVLLYLFLKILLAEFKDKILSCLVILTPWIVNLEHLHNMSTVSKFLQHLVFSANELTSLLCSFNSNCRSSFFISRLKYVTYGKTHGLEMYSWHAVIHMWSSTTTMFQMLLHMNRGVNTYMETYRNFLILSLSLGLTSYSYSCFYQVNCWIAFHFCDLIDRWPSSWTGPWDYDCLSCLHQSSTFSLQHSSKHVRLHYLMYGHMHNFYRRTIFWIYCCPFNHSLTPYSNYHWHYLYLLHGFSCCGGDVPRFVLVFTLSASFVIYVFNYWVFCIECSWLTISDGSLTRMGVPGGDYLRIYLANLHPPLHSLFFAVPFVAFCFVSGYLPVTTTDFASYFSCSAPASSRRHCPFWHLASTFVFMIWTIESRLATRHCCQTTFNFCAQIHHQNNYRQFRYSYTTTTHVLINQTTRKWSNVTLSMSLYQYNKKTGLMIK